MLLPNTDSMEQICFLFRRLVSLTKFLVSRSQRWFCLFFYVLDNPFLFITLFLLLASIWFNIIKTCKLFCVFVLSFVVPRKINGNWWFSLNSCLRLFSFKILLCLLKVDFLRRHSWRWDIATSFWSYKFIPSLLLLLHL